MAGASPIGWAPKRDAGWFVLPLAGRRRGKEGCTPGPPEHRGKRRRIMAEPTYRWVIVAAGGLMGCVAMGALFSLPVLLTPMAEATGWSRTGISMAMTIGFLAMAVTSMLWGSLSDRFGPRPVVLTGAALFALSLWLASRAP